MLPFLNVIPVAAVLSVGTAIAGTVISALSVWRTKSAVDHLSTELAQHLTKAKLNFDMDAWDRSAFDEQKLRLIEQEVQNALLRLSKDERDIVEGTLQNSSAEGKRRFLSNLLEKGIRQQAS